MLDKSELIVDSFAGGGGASLGIAWALGRAPDIAINHCAAAIAMHAANHPSTHHVLEDVWKTDLCKLVAGRPVGLLHASPDCRHFSRAKGGKPVAKSIRSLAWIVCRWAEQVRPRVITMENVREFTAWGPIVPTWRCNGCDWKGTEGQATLVRRRRRCPRCESASLRETSDLIPDPSRRGLTFRRWLGRLRNLGYEVQHRVLDAADYGAPTHRKRLFVVARRDGEPIRWPEPTHGPPDRLDDMPLFGRLKPYRTAAECIEWSQPCPSIFDRKKPLAEKTLRRIAEGIRRYVLEAAEPFIVPMTHSGERRSHPIGEPLPTITSAHRGEFALVCPTLAQVGYGERMGQTPRVLDIEEPLGTVVAGGSKHALVAAFLAKHNFDQTGQSVEQPSPTLVSRGTQTQLVAANLIHMNHGEKQWSDVREPLRTITTQTNRSALVYSFLVKYFGTSLAQHCAEPLSTVTSKDRFGLVLVQVRGEPYVIVDVGLRMLTPRELARAQGFPCHGEWRFESMTRDEICLAAIENGDILVDAALGRVYRTRGPGGHKLASPELVDGSSVNGYLAMNLTAGGVKKQVRLHRLIWIAVNGIPKDGMVVAHCNNSKTDNRIENLKILTPGENSSEAARDGLYKTPASQKLSIEVRRQLASEYRDGGITQKAIAEKYGISLSRVCQILADKSYLLTGTKTSQVARLGNSVCPQVAAALVRENLGQPSNDSPASPHAAMMA